MIKKMKKKIEGRKEEGKNNYKEKEEIEKERRRGFNGIQVNNSLHILQYLYDHKSYNYFIMRSTVFFIYFLP